MKITTKGRYALQAMIDIAANANGAPVRIDQIHRRQKISKHYLEQLFRKLRSGKLVKSVLGPGGGYILYKPANEITVKEILEAAGEVISATTGYKTIEDPGKTTREYCASKEFFGGLTHAIDSYVESKTLDDIGMYAVSLTKKEVVTTVRRMSFVHEALS